MKKTRIPRISDTEWEVMKVIWTQGPNTADIVIEQLQKQDPTWHPKTAKTLLNRLLKKQALGYDKAGRAYIYRALVNEKECQDAVSKSFLARVFGGSLRPMLAHFIERKKVSPKEVAELRRILNQAGK
jgi:BlaI family penicillinase repressor